MGTDIHGHIEYRDAETLRWSVVPDMGELTFMLNRSYTMFADLFGVRGYSSVLPFSISEPDRGFPQDCARPEMLEWVPVKGSESHSYTFITAAELIPWLPRLEAGYVREDWATFFRIMRNMGQSNGADNVRAVVWFDN